MLFKCSDIDYDSKIKTNFFVLTNDYLVRIDFEKKCAYLSCKNRLIQEFTSIDYDHLLKNVLTVSQLESMGLTKNHDIE